MLIIVPEVYSRVSGYYRPVFQFNRGKREEYSERRNVTYELSEGEVLDSCRGNRGAVREHGDLQYSVSETADRNT